MDKYTAAVANALGLDAGAAGIKRAAGLFKNAGISYRNLQNPMDRGRLEIFPVMKSYTKALRWMHTENGTKPAEDKGAAKRTANYLRHVLESLDARLD